MINTIIMALLRDLARLMVDLAELRAPPVIHRWIIENGPSTSATPKESAIAGKAHGDWTVFAKP